MGMRKLRVRLSETPIRFNHAVLMRQDSKSTIQLMDFVVKNGNVSWVVKTGTGSLVEGRLGSAVKLPMFGDNCWITLAIPVVLHKHETGIAPDFILTIPDYITPVYSK